MAALRILALIALPVVLDVVYALISKATGISYHAFIVPDDLMYIALGILVTWYSGSWWRGFVACALVAASETTLGWYVSIQLGVSKPPEDKLLTVLDGAGVFIFLTVALGTAAAFVTGLVHARMKRD